MTTAQVTLVYSGTAVRRVRYQQLRHDWALCAHIWNTSFVAMGLATSLCTCILLVKCQTFPKDHVVGASRLGRLSALSRLVQGPIDPCKETGRPFSRLPGSATKRPLQRAEPQEAAAKDPHRGSRNTFEFSAMHFDAVSDPRHTGPTIFGNIDIQATFAITL